MNPTRRAALPVLIALTAPLWGCPPNLTGEGCNGDCACPTSQTCVITNSNGNNTVVGTCQDGTNTCSTNPGGGTLFEGQVVLNGGATPPNSTWIYGYANGNPVTVNGTFTGADLTQLIDAGNFQFVGSAPPPAYDGGYRFAAVYDTSGNNGTNTSSPGILSSTSAVDLAPGTNAGLGIHIDVQTSTCYSVTIDAPQLGGETYLLGFGALIYDIHDGDLLSQPGDMTAVTGTFDAGSPLPSNFSPLGTLNLQPIGTVPDVLISNSWLYVLDAGVAPVSDTGTFFISLNDASHKVPQYPAGSCQVTYEPPPGEPSSLSLNDGGMVWMNGPASSNNAKDVVSWSDSQAALPSGITLIGDSITILGPDGTVLYNPGTVTSPHAIDASTIPPLTCSMIGKPAKFCSLRVTSVYQDARREHSTAYEGGMTILMFQQQAVNPG